jgi:8-oxo-dGTP pyrophosphatase MutT (NUDIX family)
MKNPSPKNQGKIVGIQYAALPYRIEAGQVWILLITSRGTRRWVIPKGWPMNGLKPQDAAATEAAEEAGIVGEVEDTPVGSYRYDKRLKGDESTAVQVIVFPFRVQAQAEDWKEQGQRMFEWFRYQRAATLVAEPALRHIIRDFGADRSPGLLAQGLRGYRAWRTVARG